MGSCEEVIVILLCYSKGRVNTVHVFEPVAWNIKLDMSQKEMEI